MSDTLPWPTLSAPVAYSVAGRIAAHVREQEEAKRLPNRRLLHATPERARQFYDLMAAGREPVGFDAAERQAYIAEAEACSPPLSFHSSEGSVGNLRTESDEESKPAMNPPQATDPAGEPALPSRSDREKAASPGSTSSAARTGISTAASTRADPASEMDALLAAAEAELAGRLRSPNERPPGSIDRRREGGPTAELRARGELRERGLTPRVTVVSPPPVPAAPRREVAPPVSEPPRPRGRSRSAPAGGVASRGTGPWAILREFWPVVLVSGLASCVAAVVFPALSLELYAAGAAAMFAAVLAVAAPAQSVAGAWR